MTEPISPEISSVKGIRGLLKNPFRRENNPQGSTPESPRSLFEVDLKNALSRLPKADSNALREIQNLFTQTMAAEEMTGGVLIVGGVLNKSGRRPDIDLAVYIDPSSKIQDVLTEYQKAQNGFITLKSIADDLIKLGYRMVEETEPLVDIERDNPNILRHNGSIKIQRGDATPIELINQYEGNITDAIKRRRSKFAVLVEVPAQQK